MSDLDAYRDEMRRLGHLDDRDVDRLLAGEPGWDDPGFEELAVFLRSTRARLEAAPGPDLERRHVQAVLVASRARAEKGRGTAQPQVTHAGRSRLSAILRLGVRPAAAMLALFAGTAGLAAAGVGLPDPAEDVLDRLGVSPPAEVRREGAEPRRPSGGEDDGRRRPAGSEGAAGSGAGAGVPGRPRTPAEPRTGQGTERGERGAPPGLPNVERGQDGAKRGADRRAHGIDQGQEGARRGAEGMERGAEGMERGRQGAERGRSHTPPTPAGPPQGTPPAGGAGPGFEVPAQEGGPPAGGPGPDGGPGAQDGPAPGGPPESGGPPLKPLPGGEAP
jgi:hypothetical protein